MIIDSHCHLDYPSLYENLDLVIDRARKKNVLKFLTISTKPESMEKISLICKSFNSSNVFLSTSKRNILSVFLDNFIMNIITSWSVDRDIANG